MFWSGSIFLALCVTNETFVHCEQFVELTLIIQVFAKGTFQREDSIFNTDSVLLFDQLDRILVHSLLLEITQPRKLVTVNCELSTVSSECRALLTNFFILLKKCFKIRFGVVLRPQLSLLAASWELLQSTQVPFGSSWGPLGSSWEALGSFKIDLGPMLRARIQKP